MQGACVWSLVKELGSYMLPFWCSQKEKKKKYYHHADSWILQGRKSGCWKGKWWTQGHHAGWWLRNPEIWSLHQARIHFSGHQSKTWVFILTLSRTNCDSGKVTECAPCPPHHYPWHHPFLHNWGFTFQAEKTDLFMISTPSQLWTFLASRETEKLSFTHHWRANWLQKAYIHSV